jgi:WD40 repeat protein
MELAMSDDAEEQLGLSHRDELDSTGEYFSVGTPLHAFRAGYIRRDADDALYDNLVAGRFTHVIAPLRSGKSSLIAATATRLENNGFTVAILDLEQISDREAAGDAGRWYYSVAYRMLRQLRIRVDLQTWWHDKSMLSNRQRLLEFYSEIVLEHVPGNVVIFVDQVQCIGEEGIGEQLLASIRAAHNARTTDPEFSRLTFALLGECDPLSLLSEPELSPFHVTQPVTLQDFSRDDLDLFATELKLRPVDAATALDRIWYWTAGQPYLVQKLARAIARERIEGDVAGHVDRLVAQQFTGRNTLHNEPHLSHIHREIAADAKRRDKLLNLYGRIRKGIDVPTDLGSPLQRRLLAVGLLKIDDEGRLAPRNRIYESVFTARWANENLPANWNAAAGAAAVLLVIIALPFWYTQLLPTSYVDTLTSDATSLDTAREAYVNFRSFPGYAESAVNLYRNYLERRARLAPDETAVNEVAAFARGLPDSGRLPETMLAGFWDRQAAAAMRREDRDAALLATLNSLVLSTPRRRARAAALVGADYQQLLASLPADGRADVVFNPGSMLLTEARGARVSQWSLGIQGLKPREEWAITALEISPLVRRVIIDREGQVSRVGLTLNLSHARVADLRVKLIAPSGRTVEITPEVASASAIDDLRIPAARLGDLVGESLAGTWTLSVRDEQIGVAGHLVGWNLKLDSQAVIEDFQRGLNIPDPVERETDNVWFSADGRFAVARAMQSDSARIWDLAFAKPVRAVAVNEAERLIGLSAGARLLVTAGQDAVNLWDTSSGRKAATLAIGAASLDSRLTADGEHLFDERRSDTDTRFELWSLAEAAVVARLETAGAPALTALDAAGRRIAIADFDRAVRVWNFATGELLAQIDLRAQPSRIQLSTGGDLLGVVFGESGAALWRVDSPGRPIVAESGAGRWQLELSLSGTKALIGRPGYGFQVFDTRDGQRLGPPVGRGADDGRQSLLGFSLDEQTIVTGGAGSVARFWRAPPMPVRDDAPGAAGRHSIWPPSGDAVAVATADARRIIIGDADGDVHIIPTQGASEALAYEAEAVSFLGHNAPVSRLVVSPDGTRIASAAEDNTLRVWDPATGLPATFFVNVPGNRVERMLFSEDAALLAILSSNRLHILDATSGEFAARFELAEPHYGAAFVSSEQLYLGNESGALRAVSRQAGAGWEVRTVWQGEAAIRFLAAAPLSPRLVIVDQSNRVQQLDLVEGRVGAAVLQLPSIVQELTFAPGGSRVLLRTPGWVHRANSAESGLLWLDAAPAPPGLPGASLVFGDTKTDRAATLADRVYLPVAGDGIVRLESLDFVEIPGPGLFGTREELLAEWRNRLGRFVTAGE